MSGEPSLAEALMLRSIALNYQRAGGSAFLLRRGAAQTTYSVNRPTPADANVAPRLYGQAAESSRNFSNVLAAAIGQVEPPGGSLALYRPLGQRSSLLTSTDNTLATTWPGEATALANDKPAPANVPYADLIETTAKKHGLNPNLVAAVIKAESGFNPLAQSQAGAKGLMQLMDDTARSLGVSDVFRPNENVEAGVKFLGSLLRRYNGNAQLALAAYNAGPGAVEKYGGIPPYKETQDYVSRVLSYWRQFSESADLPVHRA